LNLEIEKKKEVESRREDLLSKGLYKDGFGRTHNG